MKCSITELKSLIYNSCLGLKFEVEICKEISEAVSCLEGYNLKASDELRKSVKSKKSEIAKIKISNNSIYFGQSRVMYEGISSIDFFRTGLYEEIIFEKLDSPMILIGLGLINRVDNFQMIHSSNVIGYVDQGNFYWDKNFHNRNIKITIKKKEYFPSSYNVSSEVIEIDKIIWQEFELLSYKRLVPQSRQSRNEGAGAGIIDND